MAQRTFIITKIVKAKNIIEAIGKDKEAEIDSITEKKDEQNGFFGFKKK